MHYTRISVSERDFDIKNTAAYFIRYSQVSSWLPAFYCCRPPFLSGLVTQLAELSQPVFWRGNPREEGRCVRTNAIMAHATVADLVASYSMVLQQCALLPLQTKPHINVVSFYAVGYTITELHDK